ncbi:MAG: L-histidine N(alpha)-methyltransferase [Xenococcus sp. MO_188.B8]|nr:L-histidine N(alpha)-methyltransferase [Xenococcus sp. MO_188.B8]
MASSNFPASVFHREKIPIAAERTVALVESGQKPPLDWSSRALYIGARGTQNWLSVVHEPNYPLRGKNSYVLHKNRLAAIKDLVPATLVSLGPGDGIDDIEIVTALKTQQADLKYIPVDISSDLLALALTNLKPHIDIPVSILCDFEGKQDFLAQVLDKYAQSPILFSLLGGTVGNLDLGEASFFAKFKQLLQSGNHLLLDIPLAGPSWTAESEPRLNTALYSDAFQRFLGVGSGQWNSQFEKRIEFSLEYDDQIGAKIITIIDKLSQRTILKFKRYEWDSLLRWLKACGFAIKFAQCSISSAQDLFGMGVILLSAIEVN